jgi:hypothetical protein
MSDTPTDRRLKPERPGTADERNTVLSAGSPQSHEPARSSYSAPTVVRVRVETAQMVSGKRTRDEHCTRHWHDDATSCANPD